MFNKIYEKLKRFIKENYKGLIFIIVFAFIVLYKFPYVIYKPGGSINLNKRINIEDSYNIKGSYSMNYVTVVKGNLPSLIIASIMPNWDIKKESDITGGLDYDLSFKLEQIELKNSLFLATYNAYTKANKNITINDKKHYITYISEESDTDLQPLDQIISIDGKNYENLKDFQEYISSLEVNDKISIIVIRNNKKINRYAIVKDFNGLKKIGIVITTEYDYDANPKINIKTKSSEAGSSGGLMLSLAIYDEITKDDLTQGKNIMGTGTIDEFGLVGAIGGVKYKMLGASKDNADIFFIPKDNYEEAIEVYKKFDLKYDLVMVETFDDAINYLNSLK